MKQYLFLFFCLLMLSSCSNRRSVNILIANPSERIMEHQVVHLSLIQVKRLLNGASPDSLVLLNEMNVLVAYSVDSQSDQLSFTVPVVMPQSQKQYTLSTAMPNLVDNLFSFRHEKMKITLRQKP